MYWTASTRCDWHASNSCASCVLRAVTVTGTLRSPRRWISAVSVCVRFSRMPRRNPTQRRAAHRQRDMKAALTVFLNRLPVDVLQEDEAVYKVMSEREGRRLDFALLLEVRDNVRRIVKEREAYEGGE